MAVTLFPRGYPGIAMQPLGEVELVYLGPRAGSGPIAMADIDPTELIVIVATDAMGALVATEFERLGRLYRPMIEVETYFLACSLAAAGALTHETHVGHRFFSEFTRLLRRAITTTVQTCC